MPCSKLLTSKGRGIPAHHNNIHVPQTRRRKAKEKETLLYMKASKVLNHRIFMAVASQEHRKIRREISIICIGLHLRTRNTRIKDQCERTKMICCRYRSRSLRHCLVAAVSRLSEGERDIAVFNHVLDLAPHWENTSQLSASRFPRSA